MANLWLVIATVILNVVAVRGALPVAKYGKQCVP